MAPSNPWARKARYPNLAGNKAERAGTRLDDRLHYTNPTPTEPPAHHPAHLGN